MPESKSDVPEVAVTMISGGKRKRTGKLREEMKRAAIEVRRFHFFTISLSVSKLTSLNSKPSWNKKIRMDLRKNLLPLRLFRLVQLSMRLKTYRMR